MGLFRKRSFEHDWLPETGALDAGVVRLVEITPELDAHYIGLLDDEFRDIHHWPGSIVQHIDRGLGASKKIRHSVTKDTALVLLPEDGDDSVVVGFVSVKRLGIGSEPLQIGLQLAPEYRKRGFVSALLPVLADHLEDSGFTSVALSTSHTNKAMVRVCKKLGYRHTSVQFRHPDGEVETARQYTVLPR